ncbi:MAG: TonB-dependent receptor [Thiogranum sp.]|nr:TonB-dependent receptor [Thiogranum sp.]
MKFFQNVSLLLLTSLSALPTSLLAAADTTDPIIVTATRAATPGSAIGSAVSVITSQQIEQRQYRTLADALRGVPGLRVVQAGGPGQQASVFMRGTSSSHALVLIDGVDAADPGNPSRAVDFSGLLLNNVERIEIVRGPQSTLYGSNAIGGVINIITRQGEGEHSGSLIMEAGNHSTANQYLEVQGAGPVVDYSLGLTHMKTHGDSVTPERLREGKDAEADGSRNYSASSRLGIRLSDTLKLNLFGRYTDAESDYDPEVGPFDPANFAFFTAEDDDARLKSRQYFLRSEAVAVLLDGRMDMTVAASYTHYDRETDNDRDDPSRTLEQVRYFGEALDLSIENDFYLSEAHTLTLGAGSKKEDLDVDGFREFPSPPFSPFVISETTEADARTNYAWFQDQFDFASGVFGALGIRIDDHEDFSAETTWRTTAGYRHEPTETRITASVGTGFRAPSLFELHGFSPNNFGSAYSGNPELDPETSIGWDVGIQQTLYAGRLTLGATYFENRIDDMIQLVTDAGFNQTSENVDAVQIRGVETSLDAELTQRLRLRISYTAQDIDQDDESADTEVVRRPQHQGSADIDYRISNTLDGWLGIDYIGPRKDIILAWDSAETIDVKSYTTANATLAWRPARDWRLFGRVNNLTDEHYEPADGFQALGRWVVMGAQLSF